MNPLSMFACDKCGAAKWGEWPHGEDVPCPIITRSEQRAEELHAALLAKVNAEREAAEAARDQYLRAGMQGLDLKELFDETKRLLRGDEE